MAMMIELLRRLSGRERTLRANLQLGACLAFVAGAVNAGGFLAVQRYTSHMTGIVSALADDLVLGNFKMVLGGLLLILFFLWGAITSTVLINWARRRQMQSQYALSLMLEAGLLVVFALLGSKISELTYILLPATVLLLCFIMGLQNAMITKISNAVIRTTHVTGLITDLGIELGRALYWNRCPQANQIHLVRADRSKMLIHLLILLMFLGGAISGALAFKYIGFAAAIPLATLLATLALVPILDDLFRSM